MKTSRYKVQVSRDVIVDVKEGGDPKNPNDWVYIQYIQRPGKSDYEVMGEPEPYNDPFGLSN